MLALASLVMGGCWFNSEDKARFDEAVGVAARAATGFFPDTIELDGAQNKYYVYVPREYDTSYASPAVIFLHGKGECGTDGEAPLGVGLGQVLMHDHLFPGSARWPAIVIFPQKPTQESSWLDHERLVLATLDATMSKLNIDPDRVTLTGLSQGGCGTWEIAANNPHRFAAIAPICGYADAPNVPERVAHLPIWAFHGAKDDVVTPDRSQKIVDEVKRLQRDPARASVAEPIRFTLYPNANHNSWDAAYDDPALAAWLLSQHRRAR